MTRLRWLADECVAASIVAHLRDAGHDVAWINEDSPGISDADVIRKARTEDRLLLTEDRDFGDMIFRGFHSIPGSVLLRFHAADRQNIWPRLDAVIQMVGTALRGHHTVIEASKYRSRPLPDS